MIPFLSRHAKKASLAAQQRALSVRFGASNAPSGTRFGVDGPELAGPEESQLMVYSWLECADFSKLLSVVRTKMQQNKVHRHLQPVHRPFSKHSDDQSRSILQHHTTTKHFIKIFSESVRITYDTVIFPTERMSR